MSIKEQPRAKSMKGTNYRDSKGVYTWKEERFPSVTTILKMMDKPALPRWAAKSVAEFVTAQAKRRNTGEITGMELMEMLLDTDKLKQVPWEYSTYKRDLGSTLHDLAEQMSYGTPVNPDAFADDIRGYIQAFKTWMEASGVEYEASEFAVFNRTYNYAGTCDAIVRIGGRTIALDYKSSSDTYPEHALQLAAYRHGEFIGLNDGSEQPMPPTDGGAILIVQPDGCKLMEWPTGEEAFQTFLALRTVYGWSDGKPKAKEFVA